MYDLHNYTQSFDSSIENVPNIKKADESDRWLYFELDINYELLQLCQKRSYQKKQGRKPPTMI